MRKAVRDCITITDQADGCYRVTIEYAGFDKEQALSIQPLLKTYLTNACCLADKKTVMSHTGYIVSLLFVGNKLAETLKSELLGRLSGESIEVHEPGSTYHQNGPTNIGIQVIGTFISQPRMSYDAMHPYEHSRRINGRVIEDASTNHSLKSVFDSLIYHYQEHTNIQLMFYPKVVFDIKSLYTNLRIIVPEKKSGMIEKDDDSAKRNSLQDIHFRDRYLEFESDVPLDKKEEITLEKLWEKCVENGKRKVVIEGVAGVGKSALCKKIVQQWAAKKLWPEYDWVFLINLRGLNRNQLPYDKNKQVIDYLVQLVHQHCLGGKYLKREQRQALTRLIEEGLENSNSKVLWLLDGYDEFREKGQAESYLQEVYCAFKQAPHVLITSRPHVYCVMRDDLHLELMGYPLEEVITYSERFFKAVHEAGYCTEVVAKKSHDDFIELVFMRENIGEIAKIPINLELLCSEIVHTLQEDTMKREPTAVDKRETNHVVDMLTVTALYRRLINRLYQRSYGREKELAGLALTDAVAGEGDLIDGYYSDITRYLECLAYEGMMKDQLILHREIIEASYQLYKSMSDHPVRLSLLIRLLNMIGVVKPLMEGGDSAFEFYHLTFQEWFAARFITRVLNQVPKDEEERTAQQAVIDFIQEEKYNSTYWAMLSFVAGHCSAQRLPGDNSSVLTKRASYPEVPIAMTTYWNAIMDSAQDLVGLDRIDLSMCLLEETSDVFGDSIVLRIHAMPALFNELKQWIALLLIPESKLLSGVCYHLMSILSRHQTLWRAMYVLDQMEEKLREDHPTVCCQALDVLYGLSQIAPDELYKNKRLLSTLKRLVQSKNNEISQKALFVLYNLPWNEAKENFLTLLFSKLMASLNAVWKQSDVGFLEIKIVKLIESLPYVVMRETNLMSWLKNALLEEAVSVHWRAADALRALVHGIQEDIYQDEDFMGWLKTNLASDNSNIVARALGILHVLIQGAPEGVKNDKELIEVIVTGLDSDYGQVSLKSLKVLETLIKDDARAVLNNELAIKKLIRLLDNTDNNIRWKALSCFEGLIQGAPKEVLGSKLLVRKLVEKLESDDSTDRHMISEALTLLTNLIPNEVLGNMTLMTWLHEMLLCQSDAKGNVETAQNILGFLSRERPQEIIKDDAKLAGLKVGLFSEDRWICKLAVCNLGLLIRGDPEGVLQSPQIIEWIKDRALSEEDDICLAALIECWLLAQIAPEKMQEDTRLVSWLRSLRENKKPSIFFMITIILAHLGETYWSDLILDSKFISWCEDGLQHHRLTMFGSVVLVVLDVLAKREPAILAHQKTLMEELRVKLVEDLSWSPCLAHQVVEELVRRVPQDVLNSEPLMMGLKECLVKESRSVPQPTMAVVEIFFQENPEYVIGSEGLLEFFINHTLSDNSENSDIKIRNVCLRALPYLKAHHLLTASKVFVTYCLKAIYDFYGRVCITVAGDTIALYIGSRKTVATGTSDEELERLQHVVVVLDKEAQLRGLSLNASKIKKKTKPVKPLALNELPLSDEEIVFVPLEEGVYSHSVGLTQEQMELNVALEKSRLEMSESTSSTSVSNIVSASDLWSSGEEEAFGDEALSDDEAIDTDEHGTQLRDQRVKRNNSLLGSHLE